MQKGFKGKMTWLFYALVNNWAYSKAQVVIANSNDTKADLKKILHEIYIKKNNCDW